MIDSPIFFSGIGGSGMLPLASIVRAGGAQGRGLRPLARRRPDAAQVRLSALARDPAVPAGRLGPPAGHDPGHLGGGRGQRSRRRPRPRARPAPTSPGPQFLAQLLNAAQRSVAVGGTSGKSTVTGMIGWILHACHRQPTVMNGAVMKNFVTPVGAVRQRAGRRPRAVRQRGRRKRRLDRALPARGRGADQHQPRPQGDGRAAQPVRRISSLRARKAVRQPRRSRDSRALPTPSRPTSVIGYGFDSPGADFMGKDLQLEPTALASRSRPRASAMKSRLAVPGRHNASNALAAIAATRALGVRLEDAVNALARFEGLRRRLETVGEAAGVTVIDDFAHNPDKIDATLATLRAQPGPPADHVPAARLRPARQDGRRARRELRRAAWRPTTASICPTPSITAARFERIRGIRLAGGAPSGRTSKHAEHIPDRAAIGEALLAEAKPRRPHRRHGRARRHARANSRASWSSGLASALSDGCPMPRLFLDADGVLADFDRGARRAARREPEGIYREARPRSVLEAARQGAELLRDACRKCRTRGCCSMR